MYSTKHSLLFTLLLLVFPCLASVQDFFPLAQRISSENGLSQNTITTLAEDAQGRVWVGTRDGLNLLNNNEFIIFKPEQGPHNLSGVEITDITIARDDILWVASNAGLDRINTLTLQTTSILMPKGHQSVSKLLAMGDELFFLSEQQLYKLRTDQHRPQLIPLPNGPFMSVYALDEQRLLLTGSKGFSVFNTITGQLSPLSVQLPEGQLKAVLLTGDSLWVSLKALGVFSCNIISLQCRRFSTASGELASNNIAQIVKHRGEIYLATDNGIGIVHQASGQWRWIYPHAKNNAYQASQIALSLLAASDGTLYIGTYNGLYRVPAQYKEIQAINVGSQGFPDALLDMASISVDGQDRFAIAEPNQLSLWTLADGQLSRYQIAHYPDGFEPTRLLSDGSLLYLSSLTAGSIQWDPQTGRFTPLQSRFPQLAQEQLQQIDTPEQDIRILHFERAMKVYRQQQGQWQLLWQKAFPRGSATARYWQGRLFVAAYQSGLMSAEINQDWQAPSQWIQHQGLGIAINLQQQQDRLYILTASKGLFQALPGHELNITRVPVSDKLTSQTLVCALADADGGLLLSGHKGLVILDAKQQLQANLTLQQGVHTQEYSQFRCGRLNGIPYFGGVDGLTLIRDNKITNQAPAQPQWTLLEVDNRQTPWGPSALSLRAPSLIKLHFVATPSQLPQQATYSYRILPLGEQWTELKSSFISLINLRPGDYEIELKVSDASGQIAPIARSSIQILPDYWESPLAIGLYILAGLGIIAALVTNQNRATRAELALQIEQNKHQSDYARQLELEVKLRTHELELKKEEAMEANRAKSRFVAAASHDIKQPINVMRLQLEQFPDGPARARLHSSLTFLEQLMASVVELSRIDAKVVKPSYSVFAMQEFMANLSAEYGELARHKGVLLRSDIVTSAWAYSDPLLLRRILGNLIDNAIKISKSGDVVEIIATEHAQLLIIEVKDHGPGISRQAQQGLFVPFRRWTSSYPGSGLGLSVVKGLTEVLNIPIELQSAPNEGTSFRLSIPIKTRARVSQTKVNQVRIALIEDELQQRQHMQSLLESKGMHVFSYAEVTSFLQADEQFDVILSDVNLSDDQDGIAYVNDYGSKLQQHGVIIYMSGNPETRQRIPKQQHIFFLPKPVKWGRLAWLIQQENHRS